MVESLRMLQKTRSTAVAARRSALQMIRAIIISAPEELRDQLRGDDPHAAHPTPCRHQAGLHRLQEPDGSARIALKRLAKRYVDLDDEIDELDDMIKALLGECAPLLVGCSCVGAQSAAQLMVTVGDNPERLKSEAGVRDVVRRCAGARVFRHDLSAQAQPRRRPPGELSHPHHRHRQAQDRPENPRLRREETG